MVGIRVIVIMEACHCHHGNERKRHNDNEVSCDNGYDNCRNRNQGNCRNGKEGSCNRKEGSCNGKEGSHFVDELDHNEKADMNYEEGDTI